MFDYLLSIRGGGEGMIGLFELIVIRSVRVIFAVAIIQR